MIDVFEVEADPNDPIAAKEAAVELLGVEKGQAESLYAAHPLGRKAGEPSPYDAYMVLARLALIEDAGVSWCFHLPLGDAEIDLDYDWAQGGEPPICKIPDVPRELRLLASRGVGRRRRSKARIQTRSPLLGRFHLP